MTGRKSTRYQVVGKKRRFAMVSTNRIEVLGVKPDLRFSFVINSFHNDLLSDGGTCTFGSIIIASSEEPGIPGMRY